MIGRCALVVLSFVVLSLAVPGLGAAAESPGSRGPRFVYAEPAGDRLLVVCEKSGTLVRVDADRGEIIAETPLGLEPFALAVSPDRERLYVSCRRGQDVVELDAETLDVSRRLPARGDPTGVAVSADGERLFVALHSLDCVTILDLETGREISRVESGNGPQSIVRVPSLGRVYVTNLLSNPVPVGESCVNEVTVLDDATGRVLDRILLRNANTGRQVAFTASGETGFMAVSRPKNLVPMVQVARGWVVTNGLARLATTGSAPPVQLLVDLPNQGFADPYAVALTPDDRKLYLSCAGADTVMAIDLERVDAIVRKIDAGLIRDHANHLGLSREYVTARIAVGGAPESLAVSADGRRLYVANRLDDSLSVVDTATDRVERTIVLGKPPKPDLLARGERLFHNADRTFQNQFTCASCHPDRGFDGLQYDLEPDDLGRNILDNRNMRGVFGTAPFKWVGTNPDISTQCGTRTAKWIVRTGWLSSMEVVELTEYIHSIPPVMNPHRPADGTWTEAQRRGKEFFERETLNDGTPIPERDRCHTCHSGPHFTSRERFDVGSKSATDKGGVFDNAHLTNVFESAPYLHDGRAATLEEIWTKYNPDDTHGISSDWTKQQLNDLVVYLKAIGPVEATP